jgi:hypothetical protein
MRILAAMVLLVLGLVPVAQGSVVVKIDEHDLGHVYRDEPQKMVFEFQNVSGETLRIYDIEPSCDCTTAQVVPDAVGPDDKGRVLVFFDPMGYEGKGRLREYVLIRTSDPSDPEVMLTFWVEVGIGPEPAPRALQFGRLCRGESDTLLVTISPAPGKSLTLFDARSDTACLAVEPAGQSSGGARSFRVIATNVAGCGRVASFVTFETSDTLRPNIHVPVSVSLVGRIIAEPDIIAFGPTLPGSYVAQVVKIYSRQGVKFAIPTVVSSIDQLVPEVTATSDSSCELRLKVKEGSPPGRVTGQITLETDCPDEPVLDIKVNGYIRSDKR